MPPARTIRQRATNNENDENEGTTRLTRAKAASLGVAEDVSAPPIKKALAEKKSTNSTTNRGAGQKRAALGDLSNVKKNEVVDAKENRKPMQAKPGLVSKAQSAGVQKSSKSSSNRPVLGAKDANKTHTSSDLKRSASGSGVMGREPKKRNTGSSGSQQSVRSIKEEQEADLENQPPKSSNIIPLEEPAPAEVKYEAKAEEIYAQEGDVKQEIDEGVLDLDEQDLDDPLMVAEYVVEIFDYLRDLEETTMPNADYMSHQTFLEWHLRSVLVDWLVEVHTRFHLLPETLFLAINIIDRFLTCRVVQLDKLQLVGITAMFIASKYEEVLSPHIQNFKHVADDGFSEDEILRAERFVLQTLDYDLSYPNPMNFLRRISKADNYDIQTRTIGKYLLEIGLVDHRLLAFHPSHIAASSMYLARLILEKGPWDATIAHYSGYTEQEIQPVFKLMVDYLHKPVVHEAFFKKYASKKFLKDPKKTLLKEESKDRKQTLLKEDSKDRW
ncbi:MAG: G2/mitotic-specific cyclin [Ramalina farinacea]|uniref:G2/mitotic-specific cyclin n=1 Tax=Ramalina farinacea TaxID=258253 RepID=A0AA43QTJ9_9LECA|nr:G2/mitotic-specific cyclin [Ramalina farinacea]